MIGNRINGRATLELLQTFINRKSLLFPDEWTNFLERVGRGTEEELRVNKELEEELRQWASNRGQTLTRTGKVLVKLQFGMSKRSPF